MSLFSFARSSSWIPVVLSCLALAVVLGHVALYGAAREPDEGAAAHLFQLLMALQLPFVIWHVARWLPKEPRPGAIIFGIQVAAGLAALAPVWWLGL